MARLDSHRRADRCRVGNVGKIPVPIVEIDTERDRCLHNNRRVDENNATVGKRDRCLDAIVPSMLIGVGGCQSRRGVSVAKVPYDRGTISIYLPTRTKQV